MTPGVSNKRKKWRDLHGKRSWERDVTICIAGLFQWNYAADNQPEDWGPAALLVSDRMVTAGDSQFEPFKQKAARFGDSTHALVAGHLTIHSQAIFDVHKQIVGAPEKTPFQIAQLYGRAIQQIKQREAEDIILAPLGLNTDTFIAQQKDMTDAFVDRITMQLQAHEGPEVETIVVGFDAPTKTAQLYEINAKGTVNCLTDMGFSAIGSGAWHARSGLMQARYVSQWRFPLVLVSLYAAKKSAEVAPGVGKETDFLLVLRDRTEPVNRPLIDRVDGLFKEFTDQRNISVSKMMTNLVEYMRAPQNDQPPQIAAQKNDQGTDAGKRD